MEEHIMGSEERTSKRIEEKQMTNGMTVSLYDRSRGIIGDRWQVELVCEAVIPITEDLRKARPCEDSELSARIREAMGDTLVFSVAKVRNFVSDEERQAVMDELLGQVRENMMGYLDDPNFPRKLFAKRYEETRERCLFEERRRQMLG